MPRINFLPLIIFASTLIVLSALVGVLLAEASLLLRLFLILATQVVIAAFFFSYFRKKNKERQVVQSEKVTKTTWWKVGLYFGGFLYLAVNILLPLVFAIEYQLSVFLKTLPIALLAGLSFSLFMKFFIKKRST